VGSGETMKKRRLFVEVFTEIPFSGKRITITGTWEHIDEMNEIRTVDIIWSKILGCNFIMSKLVDVVPAEHGKCRTLGTTRERVRNKNGKKQKPLR
jgi:hypothetical protein